MKFDFMKQSKKFLILSALLLVLAIGAILLLGPTTELGVQGGTQIGYTYAGDLSATEIQKTSGPGSTVRFGTVISSATLEKGQSTMTILLPGGFAETDIAITGTLQNLYPDATIEEVSRNTILPRSSKALYQNMLITMGVIALLIVVFTLLRYRKIGGFATGFAALMTMMLNMTLLVGIYSLLRIPLDQSAFAFVAATGALSLAGAVIMLDGIRGKKAALQSAEDANAVIRQRTSPLFITGIFALLALIGGMLVGKGLSFLPMIVGILLVLCTSCFVAVPLWALFSKKYQAE